MIIEVVYASITKQHRITCDVSSACTIEEAIMQSGILTEFPEIALNQQAVGIFGKKTSLSARLTPGDRIEIYRPLTIDPMSKRRLVEKKQKNK